MFRLEKWVVKFEINTCKHLHLHNPNPNPNPKHLHICGLSRQMIKHVCQIHVLLRVSITCYGDDRSMTCAYKSFICSTYSKSFIMMSSNIHGEQRSRWKDLAECFSLLYWEYRCFRSKLTCLMYELWRHYLSLLHLRKTRWAVIFSEAQDLFPHV